MFRSIKADASPQADDPRGGFTMIEVLIALAIVSISLSALASLMASNRRVAGIIDTHLSLLETARGVETALPDRASLAGGFAGESGDLRWGVAVRPFVGNLVDPGLQTPWVPRIVTVRVEAPNGTALQVNTVRLRPRPQQAPR